MDDGIFLGLGANLGDRLGQLRAACAGLEAAGCRLVRASGCYETPAWGLAEQPPFLNAVVQVTWTQSAPALLDLAMAVEAALGRQRTVHWGPRVIDIDLLAFGDEQWLSQRLVVPHPQLHLRAFVLVPWREIAPDFRVPGLQQSVAELAAALPQDEVAAITFAQPLLPA